MKRAQSQIDHIPIDTFECYRACNNRIYILCRGRCMFYEFSDSGSFEAWKSARSIQNRKLQRFENYMACDEKGFYSLEKEIKIKKSLGILTNTFYSLSEYIAYCKVTGNEIDWDVDIL